MKKQLILLTLAAIPLITPNLLLAATGAVETTAQTATAAGSVPATATQTTQSNTLNPEVDKGFSPTGTLNPEVASKRVTNTSGIASKRAGAGAATGTIAAGKGAVATGAGSATGSLQSGTVNQGGANEGVVTTGAIPSPAVNDPSLVANNPNAQSEVSGPAGTATPGQVPPVPSAGGQPAANVESGMHTPALGPKTGGAAQAVAK